MTTDDRTSLMRELDALEIWEQHLPGPNFVDDVLQTASPRRAPRTPLFAMLAAVAAVGLVGALGWWVTRDAPVQDSSVVAATRRSITLAEGTTIVAEAGTELRWTEHDGEVVVEQLRGSAFYRVDTRHSAFSVQTPVGEVRVAGTCFSVDLEERPEPMNQHQKPLALVTVYEGRTVLANDAGEIELSAGERGMALLGTAPSRAKGVTAFSEASTGRVSADARELAALRAENQRQAIELAQLRQHVHPNAPQQADEPTSTAKRSHFSGWGPPIPDGFDHYQPTQQALEEMAECGIVAWDQPPVWADDQQPDPQYLDALELTEDERTAFVATFDRFRSDTIAQARTFYVELGGDPAIANAIEPSELLGMVYGKTDLDTREESRIALAMERAGLAEAPAEERPASERFLRWDANLGNTFEAALEAELGPVRAKQLRAARGGWPGKRSTWADLCSDRK